MPAKKKKTARKPTNQYRALLGFVERKLVQMGYDS